MWGARKVTEVSPDDRNFPKSAIEPLTLNGIIDAYMREKKNEFSPRRALHPDSIEAHFKAVRALWGDMPYAEFVVGSLLRVETQYIEWRRAGLGQGTCRKRISQLRTAFNYAYRKEMIEKVPLMELPPAAPPRERFVDPSKELPALLRAADDPNTAFHIRLQTELLLRLGCRKGALLALRWEHIDFENRVIRLRDTQTAEQRQGNKKKRENQPMDDALFELLTEAKSIAKSDHVIEWRGKPVRSTYAGQKALYRRAGLKNIHVHDLRRTSATYVYNESEGDMTAAARHIADTPEMAERTYVQKDVKVKLPGIQAIGSVLDRARIRKTG